MTGNAVIDALLIVANRDAKLPVELDPTKRFILVTAHRRENFGEPFERVCRALLALLERNPDVQVLYPVHPNPNVRDTAHCLLGSHPRHFNEGFRNKYSGEARDRFIAANTWAQRVVCIEEKLCQLGAKCCVR